MDTSGAFVVSWDDDEEKKEDNTSETPQEEFVIDAEKLAKRQKQVDYGKNTLAYQRYLQQIPRERRKLRGKDHDPITPDITQKISKRCFDGQIRSWRRDLHKFDPPGTDSTGNEQEPQTAQKLDFSDQPATSPALQPYSCNWTLGHTNSREQHQKLSTPPAAAAGAKEGAENMHSEPKAGSGARQRQQQQHRQGSKHQKEQQQQQVEEGEVEPGSGGWARSGERYSRGGWRSDHHSPLAEAPCEPQPGHRKQRRSSAGARQEYGRSPTKRSRGQGHTQGDGHGGGGRGASHWGQSRGSGWKRGGAAAAAAAAGGGGGTWGTGSGSGAADVEMAAAALGDGGAAQQEQQQQQRPRKSWADQVEAEEMAYGIWREDAF